MNVIGKLVLLHAVTGVIVWYCLASIFGRMADRAYEDRMSSSLRVFLMPGRLADRTVYVRTHRVWAALALILILIVYASAMIKTLR